MANIFDQIQNWLTQYAGNMGGAMPQGQPQQNMLTSVLQPPQNMEPIGPSAANLFQPINSTAGTPAFVPALQTMQKPSLMAAPSPAIDPAPTASVTPPQADPWAGMREAAAIRPSLTQKGASQPEFSNASIMGAPPLPQSQTASAPMGAAKPVFGQSMKDYWASDNGQALQDMFAGWAMGSTPSESIAMGAKMMTAGKLTRKQTNDTVDWLKTKGMTDEQAKSLSKNPVALQEYLKQQAVLSDPEKQLDLKKKQLEIDNLKNPTTSDMTEYKLAVQQGDTRTFTQWMTDMKKAGATNINTGDAADNNLNKALDQKTGENWAAFQQQGAVSASNLQDFKTIEPLLDVAPQGPLVGDLAKQFPGFTSVGAVVNSTVKRIAPSLRTPGSGSTSDVEYDGFLKSLPDLGNTVEANKAINSIMKSKAQINIDRAKVVDAFQSKQITREQALQNLQEINSRSIMTPEVQALISGTPQQSQQQADGPPAPAGVDASLWSVMTPEERAAWQ